MKRETCKLMVPTQPGVGDVDRHPPPHLCKRVVYADGYCTTHSAEWQEKKAAIKAARDRKQIKPNLMSSIDAAIVLLVNNGYRVEKLPAV